MNTKERTDTGEDKDMGFADPSFYQTTVPLAAQLEAIRVRVQDGWRHQTSELQPRERVTLTFARGPETSIESFSRQVYGCEASAESCPFCGGDAIVVDKTAIECSECSSRGPRADHAIASARLWNVRKTETALEGSPILARVYKLAKELTNAPCPDGNDVNKMGFCREPACTYCELRDKIRDVLPEDKTETSP